MKRLFIALFLALPFLLTAQVVRRLSKTIELSMPSSEEDDTPGTRGAAVVWHPKEQKYYAAFAGNADFPFAVFNSAGERLSNENLECLADIRGLWYNEKLNKICGNGYGDIGWFNYKLDAKGIPVENEIYAPGMNQPGDQCIGTFNAKKKQVCFLDGQNIYVYNAKSAKRKGKPIRLYPGITKKDNIDKEDGGSLMNGDYNSTVLIFTGISKAEFGLVNVSENQVELYDQKTGLRTQVLKLPSDVETYTAFNFSYTNGIYWAFNQETRRWTGYK